MTEVLAGFADDQAREAIRTELDATLFVEAGAGTGKTSALVSRIVELIATGRAALSDVAAITFTEAAAAELRARLYRSLEGVVDPEGRSHVGEIEDATITTIHGFAQRLLADFPIEAGLPLRFEVLDEIAGAVEFERRFTSFLDAVFEEPAIRPALLAATALGVAPGRLRQLARSMEERLDVNGLRIAPPSMPDGGLEALVDAATTEVARLARAATAHRPGCSDDSDYLFQRVSELDTELDKLGRCSDWLDRLRWLAGLRQQRVSTVGRKGSWTDIATVREAVGSYDECRDRWVSHIGSVVAAAISVRLAEEARAGAEERRARGRIRFHDLLVFARDLLRDHPAARRLARARYRYVLVDEFQDTDPLQLEMVLLLGGETDVLDAGRLFFVGDPKQSIYSFRGARLALYEATRSRLVGGEPTRLVTNFRSTPPVLSYVNELFAELFGTGAGEQARAGDLVPARDALSSPAVLLLGGPAPDTNASQRRTSDATEIAAVVRRALEEGWTIVEGEDHRPLRASDVAILVPTRTGLAELEAALDTEDLDYRVAHSTLIYASSEVHDLLALLRAVDDPGDERAVVAALRTAALGCSDAELAGWRSAGGFWRLDARAPEGAPGAVERALGRLRELSAHRHFQSVDATLQLLMEELSLRQLVASKRNRAEALRRLEFVLDRARAFVEATGGSIAEFLDFAAREAEGGVRGVELVAADEEVDALRILTVHGAKGLEFPFVVLADLGGNAVPQLRGPAVLEGLEGTLEFRLASGSATSGFEEAYRAARELEREEAVRLAYVGMTRARDYLVLALGHRETVSGEPSLAARIWEISGRLAGRWHRPGESERPPARANPLGGDVVQGRLFGEPQRVVDLVAWQHERAALLAESARRRSVAPSSLEDWSSRAAPPVVRLDDEEDEGSGWRRARQASALGRAVHRTLQEVDFLDPTDLESVALAAARAEEVEPLVARVAELARAALAAPVVQRAASSERYYRELPLRLELEGGVMEGIVDLCYVEDGSLVVVDYKTDALGDEHDLARAARPYRVQAGAYAFGLRAITGLEVRRFVLVFAAAPGGAAEFEIERLDLAAIESKEAMESALAVARSHR